MRIRQLLLALTGIGWACVMAQPVGLTLADAQRAAAANLEVSLARRSLASARADVLSADHALDTRLIAQIIEFNAALVTPLRISIYEDATQ